MQRQLSSASDVSTSSRLQSDHNKLASIIQNFYIKTAQIIIQSRIRIRGDNTADRINKWFNLNILEKPRTLRKELSLTSADDALPALSIFVYLDVSRLPHNVALTVDCAHANHEHPLCFQCDNVVSLTSSDYHSSAAAGPAAAEKAKQRIVVECWTLTFDKDADACGELAKTYKQSIIFFRALYTLVHLLPAYTMSQDVSKSDLLSVTHKVAFSKVPNRSWHPDPEEIALDEPLVSHHMNMGPTKTYTMASVPTPYGAFRLQVDHRPRHKIRVAPYPADQANLSALLIDVDAHYFTPTIARYTGDMTTEEPTRTEIPRAMLSLDTKRASLKNTPESPSPLRITSSMDDVSTESSDDDDNSSQAEPSSWRSLDNRRDTHIPSNTGGGTGGIGSSGALAIGGPSHRPLSLMNFVEAPRTSPFKSPTLSARTSTSSPTMSLSHSSGNRRPPPIPAPPPPGRMMPSTSSTSTSSNRSLSRRQSKLIEFSSSFDKYQTRNPLQHNPHHHHHNNHPHYYQHQHQQGGGSSELLHSLSTRDSELEELEKFMQLVSTPKSSHSGRKSIESGDSPGSNSILTGTLSGSLRSSVGLEQSKRSLSHFRNLQDMHNQFSNALGESIMSSSSRRFSIHKIPEDQQAGLAQTSSSPPPAIRPLSQHSAQQGERQQQQQQRLGAKAGRDMPQRTPLSRQLENRIRAASSSISPKDDDDRDDSEDDDDDNSWRKPIASRSCPAQGKRAPPRHSQSLAKTPPWMSYRPTEPAPPANTPLTSPPPGRISKSKEWAHFANEDDDEMIFRMSDIDLNEQL
ncbi:autophagy-related protein 13-domain-containing protein [Syncephalastrum racemosum]|uniref:Autophagy-related protein 13 n=1 Tax=Syncephalastrum racemosum TaxID=13706 RepID=A0A1X2HJM7_SYNRA|nr:autophagy-related protein 13-domain-containing protein [Syncephalastrum racemosum]